MPENLPESIPAIESERLQLLWMSPRFITASLEGRLSEPEALLGASLPAEWPDEETRRRLKMRLEQMRAEPASAPWLLRAIVDRREQRAVGIINFHDKPDAEGRAELGYTVFEPYRRLGYASEAALAMMAWAQQEHGVMVFVVSISPANEPSLRMAAQLGFEQVGSQIDEIDGEEWVFELRLELLKA